MAKPKYDLIMLKLGGEALAGPEGNGISAPRAKDIAKRVKEIREMGVQVGIVIGAATYGAAKKAWKWAWTRRPPTTWACWAP